MNQEEQYKYKKLQEELLGCKTELGLALMNHNKTIDDFQVKLDEFNNFLTKYNELLDSHNELLIALENSAEYLRNNKLYAQAQELIKKSKKFNNV